jgi:hypothetical protein
LLAPDQSEFYIEVTACDAVSGELTLGPTTPGEVGQRHCTQGRTCSDDPGQHCVLGSDCAGTCDDNCVYGPPLAMANPNDPSESVCVIRVVDRDASGTAMCAGAEADVSLPLRSVIYANGDLFTSSVPPDLPGIQPCPICVPRCQGGSNHGWPCRPDNPPTSQETTDCIIGGGTCSSASECMGGPNDGDPCTPATSASAALGDPEDSYPTSHDCMNDPMNDITYSTGGLPIDYSMTTGTIEWNAVDRPNGDRVFCGFCRDVVGTGTLCFEGDTDAFCPEAIPPADGNAVPCTSDPDCQADSDEYESCVQRNPGAFSQAGATRITLSGSADGGCLGDGAPHAADLVSRFCIPPSFDAGFDAAADLPGPGAALGQRETRLVRSDNAVPSVSFIGRAVLGGLVLAAAGLAVQRRHRAG